MFQKETTPVNFEEEYINISYMFRALNDTLVFLAQQQTAEQCPLFLLHTDSHGKTLFRKEMKSENFYEVSVKMISPKQVVVSDSDDKKIWLIDLETHKEWSTAVDTKIDIGHIAYFKQTKLLCWVGVQDNYSQFIYYELKDLKEKYAKPTIKWEHQFENSHSSCICNNHSKFWFHSNDQKQTLEFSYFDLRNNPKGELRKVRFNKQINIVDYQIKEIREIEPNIYLVAYEKGLYNKIQKELLKCFIINASKEQQSASIHQIILPLDNYPKSMEMQMKCWDCYTYFIDLGEVWVFRIHYKNQGVLLHYVRRETLELIHTQELTHPKTDLKNNNSAPHFPPFYYVEIEKETKRFKDFVLHFITLIVPFSLREVSLHFLLQINEDFDDDLLMEAVDLIAE